MEKKSPLLVVVGPTASGKTALAVSLAKQFHGEVISAAVSYTHLTLPTT